MKCKAGVTRWLFKCKIVFNYIQMSVCPSVFLSRFYIKWFVCLYNCLRFISIDCYTWLSLMSQRLIKIKNNFLWAFVYQTILLFFVRLMYAEVNNVNKCIWNTNNTSSYNSSNSSKTTNSLHHDDQTPSIGFG